VAGGARNGAGRPKGLPKTGGGSRLGKPNKNTGAIKDMILEALSQSGGVEYLKKQAKENPGPFMQLLGKIMPTQITGANNGPVVVERIVREIVDPIQQHASDQDAEGLRTLN
jgi:hypothetical protein